jgi:cytochrome c peroxidase
MRRLFLAALAAAAVLAAAEPGLAPLTGKPPFPPDNPPSKAKVELGEKLFFENRLSGIGNRSCGTCHRPELLFSDGLSRAWGLKEYELRRKTPNLYNIGWHRKMFHDARADTLEQQAAMPLKNELEMDLDPEEAIRRLSGDEEYQKLFQAAFPGQPMRWDLAAQALSTYQRTLVSYDSDLDRYLTGDTAALSEPAKRGMALFTGEFGCVRCHNGPLLSDQQMHYIGVRETMGDAPQGARYKTPSLRDVVLRAAFMHNGTLRPFEAVLDFYQGQGMVEDEKNEVRKILFTPQQRADLIAFLRSLNGRVHAVDSP